MDGLKKAVYPNGEYVEYTYDDASKLTGVKTSYGTSSCEYDKLDRLVRVVDRNGYATVYEYDKNGNRSAVRYANGIVITYKYDEVNRLICEKNLTYRVELWHNMNIPLVQQKSEQQLRSLTVQQSTHI